MKIRLGYVAIALNLNNCSTSKTITVTSFNKLTNDESKLFKLRNILNENLNNTLRILRYNKSYNIKIYRLTSKLVPLATHPLTGNWDYVNEFRDKFIEIGQYIKENNFRISAHPDHFTVINTNKKTVLESSLIDLTYHNTILKTMQLDQSYKLVVHVGGAYQDKEKSIERFILSYNKLPEEIKKRIILENDDKVYNITDVLNICNIINIPMVLDVHHHKYNNNGESLNKMLKAVFDTWKNERFPPKIHFSSPKNEKNYRSHSDYINIEEFMSFIKIAKKLNTDFDIMLEAKSKDLALFKLVNELKQYKEIKIINESEFEV